MEEDPERTENTTRAGTGQDRFMLRTEPISRTYF
jgi:hypothetical protein